MRDTEPSLGDRLLTQLDRAVRVLAAPPQAARPNPAAGLAEGVRDPSHSRHAAGLMRINHAGEVCAQALYFGHAEASRSPRVKAQMLQAAAEEGDHLAWCQQRLDQLEARPSLLNPLWYAGAYALGFVSAKLGDAYALGFVAETEKQVEAHLNDHLEQLPAEDQRSRAIVAQMRQEEIDHGQAALRAGGRALPWPLPNLMRQAANLLRTIAYRV